MNQSPDRARFVGREDDVRGVRTLLDDLCSGAAVVLGEAGMGKTALLDEIASRFAAEGVRTLRASGAQFASDESYSALHQLLSGAHDAFDQLDEVHRNALRTALGFAGGPAPGRILVANAVLLLVRAIAGERPLVLIVDDLHWVDRASARVLAFVSRRLAGSTVRFLGSARSGSAGCSEFDSLPQYRLHPLTEDAAQSLVGDELEPAVRRRVLAEAAGNPLALLELPEALTGSRRCATEGLPADLPLPERLEALYADRFHDLPDSCRWTLLLGALGGRDAARVAGRNGSEMLAPAECEHLVSVAADGGEFTFRNSLIRAAVVSESTTADRRRAHQALATALSASPERRAWHLGEAATEPDENVAALLENSAELAHARGDSERAIAALARAAELSAEPHRRARRLALAALLGADAAGEIGIAEQFASSPPFAPEAPGTTFDLVEAAVHAGRLAEARAHAAAMREVPGCLLSSRLALLSAGAAGLVAEDADVRDTFETALRCPDAHRWPFEHARIRLAFGERLRRMRATQEARGHLRAAAEVFRELPAPSWLERAESEIRATGLSRPRNAVARFAELTPKEREIAELAASGMSNKEIGERLFLSHRTIGSHLYQIFPKLGLSSRAGLRDALLDLSERQRV